MIKSIKLKFGSTPLKESLEFQVTPVTVIIGPNNSGKSYFLRELKDLCQNGRVPGTMLLIEKIAFHTVEDPEKEVDNLYLPEQGHPEIPSYGKPEYGSVRMHRASFIGLLQDGYKENNSFCSYYVKPHLIYIDGEKRMDLVAGRPAGDLKAYPQNSLTRLFRNEQKRGEVRRIIKEAFNKYYVIDPTNLGSFSISLSEVAPPNRSVEKGIDDESIQFYKNASPIIYFSDGVKAFTGIITNLIGDDPRIIIIDEPEAFLHPSLAQILGKEMSGIVRNQSKNLFISTHSANILMGCIQSKVPVNVIRLTYSAKVPTARILQQEKLIKLMRNPLLRSIGVLNSLFYEYVIITEGDSDRAFYQEINERMLVAGEGIQNCLFLNAQNKQTIHDIIKPLREMGILCVGIMDIDVIKEGGTVWSNLMTSANLPQASISATATSRSLIKKALDSISDYKSSGGIKLLSGSDQQSANDLFDQLDSYGLFTVREGEVECWLKNVGANGYKTKWLIDMFEKMGEDPASDSYVKPSTDDVWAFIRKIKSWFENEKRKGMPE